MRRISCSIFFFSCLSALPLFAQDEALVGTWEAQFTEEEVGDVTLRLTFEADGGFQLDQIIMASDSFMADLEDAVQVEELTVRGTGTYRADGDSLSIDLTEVNMAADGRDFVDILTEVARAFARFLADLEEISDEDYPAFEEAAVEEFLAGFNAEEQFIGFAGTPSAYRVDGDTLTLTTTVEGEEDVIELMRVDPSSAVAAAAWGRLKSDMRR